MTRSITTMLVASLFLSNNPTAEAAELSGGRVNVTPYASAGDGTSGNPWVDALRNAIAAKKDETTYYMPQGHYKDESTLLIPYNDIRIEGDGGQGTIATTIHYDKTDGSTCWKFAPPAGPNGKRTYINGITVRGVAFRGAGKPTGSCIEIEALRRGLFEDISIWRWDGDKENFSNKGIWTKGWDTVTFRDIWIYRTPTCFYIDKNPNFHGIDADHFVFENMYLACGNREHGIAMHFVAPHITNVSLFGTNAIMHANKGIYIQNRGSGGHGTTVSLNDLRIETGSRPDCWGIYVDTDYIVNFLCNNIRVAGGYNGFYFRGAAALTLMNCYVMGGDYYKETGYVAYDIDAHKDTPLVMINATYNKSPNQGYKLGKTVQIKDELQISVGDAFRVHQDGADVYVNGIVPGNVRSNLPGAAPVAVTVAEPPAAGRAAGPLFHVPFDDSPEPATAGGGKTVSIEGNETHEAGIKGQGILCGENQARCDYSTAGNFDITQGTIALWFQNRNWHSKDDKVHMFFNSSGQPGYFRIFKQASTDVFSVQANVRHKSGKGWAANTTVYARVPDMAPGGWHHLAVTWDDSHMSIYFDGTLRSHGPEAGETMAMPAAVGETFTIGDQVERTVARTDDVDVLTAIDELMIYGRPLTAREVLQHFEEPRK